MSAPSLSASDGAIKSSALAETSRMKPSSSPHRYPRTLSSGRPRREGSPRRLETFEDLLREAGYKHTRVVTPRAERLRKDAATYSSESNRPEERTEDIIGASYKFYGATVPASVANFLTSWVAPSQTMSLGRATSNSIQKRLKDGFHTSRREQAASAQGRVSVASSALRKQLQPKPSLRPASSSARNMSSTGHRNGSGNHLLHSPSSNTTVSTITVRPKDTQRRSRIRHTVSSPQISSPLAASPTSSSDSRGVVHTNRISSGSSPHNRRSPLPETWFGAFTKMVMGSSRSPSTSKLSVSPSRENRRPISPNKARRRSFSNARRAGAHSNRRNRHQAPDKLLARSRSYAASRLPTTTTTVNIICRSSSVGAAARKRPPLLMPSTRDDNPLWADVPATSNFIISPNTRIQFTRGLRRTGSMSTARTSLSRGGPGTPGVATPSPLVAGGRDTPDGPEINFHHYGDEGDTDEEFEPHLANILAPRPERQQSIQSLKACLHRHQSFSNSQNASPSTSSFAANISGTTGSSIEEYHPVTPASTSLSYSQAQDRGKGAIKRAQKDRVFEEDDLSECIRVIESTEDEEVKRGRRSQRGSLLRLGMHDFRWNSPSTSTASYRSPIQRAPLKSRPSDKELERERLLWGTAWGRDHS